MGELRKKREVRIVNYEEKYLKLVWRLRFISPKAFVTNFFTVHKIKNVLLLNK